MKNPHFESVEKSGWDAIKACADGYEAVYKEAVTRGQDSEMRKAASAERKSGDKRLSHQQVRDMLISRSRVFLIWIRMTKNNKIVVGMTHEALESCKAKVKQLYKRVISRWRKISLRL